MVCVFAPRLFVKPPVCPVGLLSPIVASACQETQTRRSLCCYLSRASLLCCVGAKSKLRFTLPTFIRFALSMTPLTWVNYKLYSAETNTVVPEHSHIVASSWVHSTIRILDKLTTPMLQCIHMCTSLKTWKRTTCSLVQGGMLWQVQTALGAHLLWAQWQQKRAKKYCREMENGKRLDARYGSLRNY